MLTAEIVILAVLLVLGALAGPKTLLHSFAIGMDVLVQGIIWNDKLSITISARCGKLQERGVIWPSRFVNFVMRNPNHCEEAIGWDIDRARKAIAFLEKGETKPWDAM